MQIIFDHITGFGKITHQDFIYSNPEGILENTDTPDDALDRGWIPWKDRWYNHRSVRINLDEYHPGKTTKKDFKKITCDFKSILEFKDFEKAKNIYNIYCEKNSFLRTISISDIINDSSCFFEFKYQNKTRGYTFSSLYKESMVSHEFIQDFSCKNFSLGSISQHYECLTARNLNKKYVYLMGAYETTCLYKCNFYGMEWWTGKEWSRDKNLLYKLCQRDNNIRIDGYDNDL